MILLIVERLLKKVLMEVSLEEVKSFLKVLEAFEKLDDSNINKKSE